IDFLSRFSAAATNRGRANRKARQDRFSEAWPRRQRMKRQHFSFETLSFLLLLGSLSMFLHSASGQSTSVVEGTLVDSSNAAVPDAEVTLTNEATQIAYRSRSNNLGVFRVTTLPLGIYRAQIEAKGFKPWVQTSLALEAGQVRTLNVSLEIGAAQQTV